MVSGAAGLGAGKDEIGSWGLERFTVIAEVRIDASRASDGVELIVIRELGELLHHTGDLALTTGKEPCRMGVAVDGGAIGDLVVPRNLDGASPTGQIAFDGVAIEMVAD